MENWLDGANDVDQSTVETSGARYPFIQWVNGEQKMKKAGDVSYTGGWFMSEAQAAGFDMRGWSAGDLTHKDGSFTHGWFTRDLTVAVIRLRRSWLANGQRYAWDEYKDARDANGGMTPKSKLQALVLVRGWQQPVVLTMSGTTGAAFVGSKQYGGALAEFDRQVIQEANLLNLKRGVNRKFPRRAFWLTVGPARNADGSPTFTEVGQAGATSFVTLPVAIGLPEKPTADDLGKLYVGAETLTTVNMLYAEAEAWGRAWDAPSLQGELPGMPPADMENLPF